MYKVKVKLEIEHSSFTEDLLVIRIKYPNRLFYIDHYTRNTEGKMLNYDEMLELISNMHNLKEFVKGCVRKYLNNKRLDSEQNSKVNFVNNIISELNKNGIVFKFDDDELL